LIGYTGHLPDASNAGPASYTLTHQIFSNDTNDTQTGGALRFLTGGAGASENPGTFTGLGTGTSAWIAYTMALRPATGGGTTESRTFTSVGLGAASFSSALELRQTFTSAGAGTAAFTSAVDIGRTTTSAGAATVSFTSRTEIGRTFTAAGVGAASFVPQGPAGSATFTSAGAATVSFTRGVNQGRTLTSAGAATVSFSLGAIQGRSLTAAGSAAVSFTSLSASVSARLVVSATSSVSFVGQAFTVPTSLTRGAIKGQKQKGIYDYHFRTRGVTNLEAEYAELRNRTPSGRG
jgi:hypothetical protein